MDYDVVIIGAGPAGCAAAYDLCASRRQVLLLDKREFPREKPCAGGLTPKTLEALRYSVAPVVKNVCSRMVVGKGLQRKVMFDSRHPVCAMTTRSRFDVFCLEKTIQRGASFDVVKTIGDIEETDTHVNLHTDKGIIRSKFLIGADGVHSRVRQLIHEFDELRRGFAIEGIVPMDKSAQPAMELDFDAAISGYGWVFPKADHANVGVYSSTDSEKLSKKQLIQFVKNRFSADAVEHVRGYPIGMGGWNYKPMHNRIILAGDAAGMADPLLGEGIFYAIKSGQLAALAVEQGLSDGIAVGHVYNDLISDIKNDLRIAYRTARWFYRYPDLGYAAMTFFPIKHVLLKGFAMGWTMSQIIKQCYRIPFVRDQGSGVRGQN